MADHLQPQPPPVANDKPAVWDLVLADTVTWERHPRAVGLSSDVRVWGLVREDMRHRDAQGRERYGTPLQPHNGRDALADAYQEALDKAVYLRQAEEELPPDNPFRLVLAPLIEDELHSIYCLRRLLLARDGR